MVKISVKFKKLHGPLAEKLMCAYLAHISGMKYETIRRRYVEGGGLQQMGDYWYLLAARTVNEQTELLDRLQRKKT